MNPFSRPTTLAEAAVRIANGSSAGDVIKDFLHEFQVAGSGSMLSVAPQSLARRVENGEMLDAFLQALAVYLAVKLNQLPPEWTQPAIQLKDPWFASPGPAIRNYLLLSSPAPFRARNLFVDEDSLQVV